MLIILGMSKLKIIVFGADGWIAGQLIPLLEGNGFEVIMPPNGLRADDVTQVVSYLSASLPDRVLSLIGRTHGLGVNTIDYLEKPGKLVDNIRDNLFAPVSLAYICDKLNIHFTYLGTGCIFSTTDPTAKTYNEEALPDFSGSSYSIVKGFTDRFMHLCWMNTLNVRIRMPITGTKCDRNFISKITKYNKICSIPNSMTVLPVLLPILVDMIKKKQNGTVNLTNPGVISHNEILEMYKEIVDPGFTYSNFTIEEQNAILLSERSNNQLDTALLQKYYPEVVHIKDAVRMCLSDMATLSAVHLTDVVVT
jgi:nucleoside-diphosphate-sugar epimerase